MHCVHYMNVSPHSRSLVVLVVVPLVPVWWTGGPRVAFFGMLRLLRGKRAAAHILPQLTRVLTSPPPPLGRREGARATPFLDELTVSVKAGDGGPGCVSFLRERARPFGGPNGGDGGDGGSVVLTASSRVHDLSRLPRALRAKNGGNGLGSERDGKAGSDVVVPVPVGTMVSGSITGWVEKSAGEGEEGRYVVPDKEARKLGGKLGEVRVVQTELAEEGEELVVARGGMGGMGNAHFATSINRIPRSKTLGLCGEEGELILELRVMADVGLVGFPNAGKSTLLAAMSGAHPKIGAYPFTTLNPGLGVVTTKDGMTSFTVADLPGLIDGASADVGLGHRFLRHVERTSLIAYVVDMAPNLSPEGVRLADKGAEEVWDLVADDPLGSGASLLAATPWDQLEALQTELGAYDPHLLSKPALVLANKMDIQPLGDALLPILRSSTSLPVLPVSAGGGQHLEGVIQTLSSIL